MYICINDNITFKNYYNIAFIVIIFFRKVKLKAKITKIRPFEVKKIS